jgi:hypothetical protein
VFITINSTIVQKRGVMLQLRTLLTDPVVNNLSLRGVMVGYENVKIIFSIYGF